MMLFVYGSLRRGFYNHELLKGKAKFFKKAKVKGYKLYSLGSYPAVVCTMNPKDVVIGEIYTDVEPGVMNAIDSMEIGAGYDRQYVYWKKSKTEKVRAKLYAMYKLPNHADLIPSGDWKDCETAR